MSEAAGAAGAAEPAATPPRFAAGDRVRTHPHDPDVHTRLPRYARGRTGRVLEVTAAKPLPDDVTRHRPHPRVEPVYTVAFTASDLWGEGAHEVTLDLWESYLEPEETR